MKTFLYALIRTLGYFSLMIVGALVITSTTHNWTKFVLLLAFLLVGHILICFSEDTRT